MAGVTYLVDFENVGNGYADSLSDVCGDDTVILFYSENSPKAVLEKLESVERRGARIRFRKCWAGAPSALDFQLSSELGFLMATDPDEKFAVVSDDAGYQALAEYWGPLGREVGLVRPCRRQEDAAAQPVPGPPVQGMPEKEARRAVDAWLDAPMTQMGLEKHARNHILGCARGALTHESDPGRRMARFESDTKRIKGEKFWLRIRDGILPALTGLFAS